ncbi:uncharacterized protein TNCV_2233301 [Trichonephila clavipes]|nr:uncharacterized protein TNCV_2233301 [Trichonephila clavipes]
MDFVTILIILSHGQVMRLTTALVPLLTIYQTTVTEDVGLSDRFNVHRFLTRWVSSRTRRTQLEVSEELGIAQSVISRLLQRFQDDGIVIRCYSTGRPRVTMPNEDRYLSVTAKRNTRSTASDLSHQLSSASDWPAYLHDLNAIKHVWDMLGRRIAARQPPPTCLTELRRAFLDEWCKIPEDQIDNLILNIPRRCKVCISPSWRHTPY